MTSDRRRKYLLFIVAYTLLNQSSVGQKCDVPLSNKAVYEGTVTSFPRSSSEDVPQWQVTPSSSTSTSPINITAKDGSVDSRFKDVYAADTKQLTVLRSTSGPQGSDLYATAGMYAVNYPGQKCKSTACLVVVRSGPVCSCDASDPGNVKRSCSVDYSTCRQRPINAVVTWKVNGGVAFQDTPRTTALDPNNPGLQRSASLLSNKNDADQTYECQVTFSAPTEGQSDNMANNQPNFTASCYVTDCSVTTTVKTKAENPTTVTVRPREIPTTVTVRPTTPAEIIKGTSGPLSCSSMNLTNIVVIEGAPASFPRVDNGQSALWQMTPSCVVFSTLKNITNYDDVVVPEFRSLLAVSQKELTVLSATVAPQAPSPYCTAGLYILKYRNPNCTTAANLIVLRSGPVCACDASNKNKLKVTCSFVFAQSTTQPCNPNFRWTDVSGRLVKQEQTVPFQYDRFVKRATSQLFITSGDKGTYKCEASFNAPSRSPFAYVSSIAPDYKASCTATCG